MAISIGISASAASASATATTGAGVSQATGSTFVVGVQSFNNTPISTPTDSKGNVYTAIEIEQTYATGQQRTRWFECENGTGGSGHTFTGTSTGASVVTVYAAEIIGALTSSALDQHNVVHDTVSPFASPSITPTVASSLVLSFFAGAGAGTPSTHAESNGFTILPNTDQADGTNFTTGCLAYKILSSAAATNSSFTELTNVGDSVIFIADFKAAAVAVNAVDQSNSLRPGRGPFSKGRFRVSDSTAFTSASNPDVTVALTGSGASFSTGTIFAPSVSQFYEAPNFPRPGRGPFSKGRFYVSDTTPFTSSSNVTVALTGQGATVAAGSAVANRAAPLNGQSATVGFGSVLAASQIVVTGQSASASAGSLLYSAQIALSGQPATFTPGTVAVPGGQTLVGQPATFTAGNLSPNIAVALAGQAAAITAGTVVAGRSLAFTGNAATSATGNLLPNSAVGVSGQAGAFNAGIVTPPGGVTTGLTGQAASFASGSITPSVTIGLTGQSLTSSAGVLGTANAHALAGLALTSAQGTLLGSFTAALTGQPAVFSAGLVLPPGDKTASLTGSIATFHAGSVLGIGAILSGTPRYVVRRQQKRIFTVSAVSYLQFPPKDTAEAVKLEFDFSPDLDTGVLLSGTPVVTVTMSSGADGAPAAILNGLPRFDVTSTQVIVPVIGGIANCDYDIKVASPTTDSLTILALSGILPVRA